MKFGIPGYDPIFYNYKEDIIKAQKHKLSSIIGKSIKKSWTMWDLNRNEWYNDGPILLAFDDTVLEVCVNKLDELAITFNTIDVARDIEIMDLGEYGIFEYVWKENSIAELNSVLNKELKSIDLIEYNFTTEVLSSKKITEKGNEYSSWLLNGIGFELEEGYLGIYNALDENGVTNEPLEGDNYRKYRINEQP